MSPTHVPWVLVVDDTEANRYAVSRMLRAAGFEVTEAAAGRQALRLAASLPDLIVLDVNLPDMSGFAVVRELRATPTTAGIPVLHLSASYMRDEDRVQGLDGGADGYLTHPVDPTVFVATVKSLLRVRAAEDELKSAARDWQATFDAISEAVFVLDARGRVVRANRAAERVIGVPATALVGQELATALRPSAGLSDDGVLGALVRQQSGAYEVRARDRWLRVVLDPMPASASHPGSLVCVVSDVTARAVAERERGEMLASTETARADAEAANAAKGEFLATMSHELRTPINAILGYAQLLDMGIAGSVSAEQRAHLDRLRRSAAHLLGIVDEILDLSKADAGRMRIRHEHAIIDDAVEAALAVIRPLAVARGLAIDNRCGVPRPLAYVGDPARTRQILVNLLSNAVKFTPPGGRITIDCERCERAVGVELSGSGPWLSVSIADTGIGIDAALLGRVFEPFTQAESGRTRRHGGTGLGLTISRKLARLMGGELVATSTVGAGSRLTLWLPAGSELSSVRTAELPATRGRHTPAAYDPRLLARAGHLLEAIAGDVTTELVRRLRADPVIPASGALADVVLADHTPAFVSDLARSLVIIAETDGNASALLRDGSAIRTMIAERHGSQRAELGWTEEHLDREYALLTDVLEAVVGGHLADEPTADPTQVEGLLGLLARLVDQGAAESRRAHAYAQGQRD